MDLNIIEGATDKSESGLRAILRAQAKLRFFVAIPVVIGGLLLFSFMPDRALRWPIIHLISYCLYVLCIYGLTQRRSIIPPRFLLIVTAILDPLALSGWLIATGEYGSLIVGFYLFTTLGFGFRTGRPLMYLCQIFSILGFIGVLIWIPYWQRHPIIWSALLVPLIVVPAYAGALIKTLREARDLAKRESQAKTELLAKVSHELRTPLTGIVAAAELLAAESKHNTVAKRTETILALSNELLCEINDLLDEAKFGAHAVELKFAPVDLVEQVSLLRAALEPMASRKGLQFRADIDPTIADLVDTDAHHLARVLFNLTGNAVKFTDKGAIRLAIDLLDATPDEYQIRFSVTDTGIGIPESFRAKIFEPFSQADQGTSRRYGGTGLGLALSRQIVHLLGGELRFDSIPGKGSRFWFELKLRRVIPMPVTASKKIDTGISSPQRILVAEDNATNLLLLKELLEIDGHTVTTCTNGMETLELLSKQHFDVLLLDYNLGDMDGVRVLQTYRFGHTNPAPALFLTADATLATASRLQAAGGAGILYKPVNLAALRKALSELNGAITDDIPKVTASPSSFVMENSKPQRPALTVVPVSPLDPEVIEELRTVSTRPEFFALLLFEAENDITRNCQLIFDALVAGNPAQVREAAHALKGVGANVGATRLVALASNLMLLPSEEMDHSRERLATDLREASHLTLQALKKTAGDGSAASSGKTISLHPD